MKTVIWILLWAALLIPVFPAEAAPMDGEPIEFTQPNGRVIHLQVFGDEYYAETRTQDGYTVFFDPASKAYYYAVLSTDGNEFASSGMLVGTDAPPAGLPKRLTIKQESKREKIRQRIEADESEADRSKRWKAIKEKTRDKRQQKKDTTSADETPAAQDAPSEGDAIRMENIQPAPPASETTGDRIGLTILVEFPDEAGTITQQQVDDYCNKPGYSEFGNDGSIFDYFNSQSGGKLRYYNVVTPYVTAPHPKSYYNDTSQGSGYCGRLLLNDVLQVLMAKGFDFSHCSVNASGRLHAVNMFFTGANSGVWSYGLWPHKSSLSPDVDLGGGIYADGYQTSNMGTSLRIGTFCHENGHLLCGFPDLYDYDTGADDSRGSGGYSLMCVSGSYHPVSVGAYLRYHAGWAEVEVVDASNHYRGAARVDDGTLYQYLNTSNLQEYFLVENRAKIGYENGSSLPDAGLMVMHCDEAGERDEQEMSSTNHYEVSVEQADGLFHLEYNQNNGGAGDLFHSGDKALFNDSTLPNTRWWSNATTDPASGDASGLDIHDISVSGETMTFIMGSGPVSGSPEVGVDRTMLEPRAYFGESPETDKVAVWNRKGGTLSYTVTSATSWITLLPIAGTVTTESDLITISYNTTELGSGTHYGQILVSNIDTPADIKSINVELTIEALPQLAISPSSITITGAVGSVSAGAILLVDNTGGGEMSYSVNGPFWLAPSASGGMVSGEADAILITFDGAGMTEGTYAGTLTVASPDAANSPISIPLTYVIRDLILTTPLEGQFSNSDTVSIEWSSSVAAYPAIDIELWRGGQQKVVIADNTENDGSYLWTIPPALPSGSNYTIRVSGEGAATYKESGPLGIWIYRESFESGLGSWVHQAGHDFDWTRKSGGTGSSNTGPDGAPDGTYYIYTEASSPNFPSKTAVISNHFALAEQPEATLIFDYHMYGASMGSLHLDIFDGTTHYADVWTVSGEQHSAGDDSWTTVTIDLAPYTSGSSTHLQFRGITGSSFTGDMAVDHIRLANWVEILLTNSVPAAWMQGFGLTADDATALLDFDGDGLANWAEYFTGTSPIEASSVMEMKGAKIGPGGVIVSWSAVYGKSYSIIYRQNMLYGDWSATETGLPGVEPLCTHTVATDQVTGFIKIKVDP